MVKQQLLDYVRNSEAHGHLPGQVYNRLISQGWSPREISDALRQVYPIWAQGARSHPVRSDGREYNKWQNQLNKYSIYDHLKTPVRPEDQPLPPPPKAKNPIFSRNYKIAGIVLLVILAIISAFFFARPSCGNGLVESTENSDNCCIDAGCPGNQLCEDNHCTALPCGECQYLDGTECRDYECCSDEGCFSDEVCIDHMCQNVQCGDCQYVSFGECHDYECCKPTDCLVDETCQNHNCTKIPCGNCQYVLNKICVNYACCSDADCNDNDPSSTDVCKNPGTTISYCKNVVPPKCITHQDCDDGDPFTIDVCAGNPRRCWNLECKDNDDCDDHDNSTKDICAGKPGGKCYNVPIRMCRDDDGYCPWTCTYIDDAECPLKTLDCHDDFGCMIDASQICGPAVLLITQTTEQEGVVTSTSTINAIIGNSSGKCEFVQRIQNISLHYTDEKIQEMDENETSLEIMHQEFEDRRIAQDKEGSGLKCLFSIDDLSAMFLRWDHDNFSESDLASCDESDIVICTNLRLDINESTDINGIYIELLEILNDSIRISVDGLTSIIPFGQQKTVNGLQVMNDGHENITARMKINCDKCVTGDDYCPSTCKYASDRDCERIFEECADMDCMIDATDECVPSEYRRNSKEEVSGTIYDTDFADSIGDHGNTCIYTAVIEGNDAEFSDELVQTKLDSGQSQSEIAHEEELARLRAAVNIGTVIECSYSDMEQLAQLLEKIDNDTQSTLADCTPGSVPSCTLPSGLSSGCSATPPDCTPVFLEVNVTLHDGGKTIVVTGFLGDLVNVNVNGAEAGIKVGEYQVIGGLKVEVKEIHMNQYVELALSC